MIFKFVLTAAVALLPIKAWSQSYQLGQASFAGSGCQQGTTSAIVSPDGTSISFLFDAFKAEFAPPSIVNNTQCSIVVPVTLTEGYKIRATYIDLRGFASIPNRGYIAITSSGLIGHPRMSHRFGNTSNIVGPKTDSFFIRQTVPQGRPGKDICMRTNELRIELRAQVVSRLPGVQFALDSGDIGSDGVTVGVEIEPCNDRPRAMERFEEREQRREDRRNERDERREQRDDRRDERRDPRRGRWPN